MLRLRAGRSSIALFERRSVLVFHTAVVFALIHSCRGQSEVVGPLQPVVALIGDDVVLPCHLDPVMDAFDMTVEWARPDLDPRFVLVWRDSVDLESKKHQLYNRRTSLFTQELKSGNISLKISRVKQSDEGTYTCFVPGLDRDATVRLLVGAASSPVAQINRTSSRVVLQCESAGWYPEPELLWLDGERNLLPAGPTETLRGPDGLYTVSSRVTVEKKHGNNFTCRVQQKSINQHRETHIHVPDDFFMVISPSSPPSDPSIDPNTIIGLAIGAVVGLIPAVSCVVWKLRQTKCRNTKSEEDGPEQTIESKNDNRGFHVVVEEGESKPLMAGREEEDDVDSRGEKKFKEERETQQDKQRRDAIRPETNTSTMTEKEPQIKMKEETHEEQEMRGRGMKAEEGEGEREKKMEGGKVYSGLQFFPLTEAKSFNFTFHLKTDQEPWREKEKQQEQPVEGRQRESDVIRKKSDTKKERSEENRSEVLKAEKKRREHQREKLLAERREKNQKKQSETRTEREKDETELQIRKSKNQHHKKGKTQKRREEESEHEKHGEGNQTESLGMTGRKTEEQRGQEESLNSSVSSKVTLNTDLKIPDKRRQNQEKQPENKSQQSREEIREQPEKQRRAQREEEDQSEGEDQREMMEPNEGVISDGTNRKERENLQLTHEKIQDARKHQNVRNVKKFVKKQNVDCMKVDDAAHSQHAAITQQHETIKWPKELQMLSEQKEPQGHLTEHDEDLMEVKEHSRLQFPPFTEEPKEQQPVLLAEAKTFNWTSHLNSDQEPRREKETQQSEQQRRAQSEEEDQREMIKPNKGVIFDGTNSKEREKLQLTHGGALQAEQQVNVNQKEEPEESVSLTEKGVDCLKEPQEEKLSEVDEAPDADQHNINKRKPVQEAQQHEVCNLPAKKQKIQEGGRARKHKNVRKVKKFVKKQNVEYMEVDVAAHSQHAAITQQHETIKWPKEQQMLSEQKEPQGYLTEHDEDLMQVEEHSGLQFPSFTEEPKELQPVLLAEAKTFNWTSHLHSDEEPQRGEKTKGEQLREERQAESGGVTSV